MLRKKELEIIYIYREREKSRHETSMIENNFEINRNRHKYNMKKKLTKKNNIE